MRKLISWLRGKGRTKIGGIVGVLILTLFLGAAILGPVIYPASPSELDSDMVLATPSWQDPFGRDQLGRDQLARVLDASKIALLISIASVIVGSALGIPLGLIAGFVGGKFDKLVSALFEMMFGLPSLLFALVLAAVVGPGVTGAIVAIGLVFVPRFGRIARSGARSIRESPFVDAARLSQLSTARIVVRHVLPNALSPLIVLAAMSLSMALLTYAALSFLGLGVPPPQADFGSMLSSSRNLMVRAPHLVTFPAAALVLLIIGFNLVGDWLRDELDPRTESSNVPVTVQT